MQLFYLSTSHCLLLPFLEQLEATGYFFQACSVLHSLLIFNETFHEKKVWEKSHCHLKDWKWREGEKVEGWSWMINSFWRIILAQKKEIKQKEWQKMYTVEGRILFWMRSLLIVIVSWYFQETLTVDTFGNFHPSVDFHPWISRGFFRIFCVRSTTHLTHIQSFQLNTTILIFLQRGDISSRSNNQANCTSYYWSSFQPFHSIPPLRLYLTQQLLRKWYNDAFDCSFNLI